MEKILTWFFENFDPSNNFMDHMAFVFFSGAIIMAIFLVFAGIYKFIDRYVYPITDKMVEFFSGEIEDEDEE